MANALYRRLSSGDWLNQANPGGPSYFALRLNTLDGNWYINFTYDGGSWFQYATGSSDVVVAQAFLDAYVASLNAGTA